MKEKVLLIFFIAHTMSETIAQNRVFIYDPHLVSQIAQLVSYDKRVPIVSCAICDIYCKACSC